MSDDSLNRRTGLPEALRVLLDAYPRADWAAHPEFDGLTRFWLDRHLGFRDLMAGLTAEVQGFVDGRIDPGSHAGRVWRMGSGLIEGLHGHHGIEDDHYFPLLAGLEPRLARGFGLLDADHKALDGQLAALAGAANAHLRALAQGQGARDSAGALLAGLGGLAGVLDRHLTDEEDLIVPVILHHAVA